MHLESSALSGAPEREAGCGKGQSICIDQGNELLTNMVVCAVCGSSSCGRDAIKEGDVGSCQMLDKVCLVMIFILDQ